MLTPWVFFVARLTYEPLEKIKTYEKPMLYVAQNDPINIRVKIIITIIIREYHDST